MGLIRSDLTVLDSEFKKLFFIVLIGRKKKTIHGLIVETKLPEQNFHHSSFVSKRLFICFGVFLNFVVVVVFINCSNL